MLITVMLLNLVIAMMTRTYEVVFATRKEYKRQVGISAIVITSFVSRPQSHAIYSSGRK
jgi:hypothetical protein